MHRSLMVIALGLGLAAGCGSAPVVNVPDNQPATGPIKINNASMRFTGMVACGPMQTQMCHDYDISFTLTNSAAYDGTGATALFRMDTLVLTVNGVNYGPANAPSCSQMPWNIIGGQTSGVIDLDVQTDVPSLSLTCGTLLPALSVPGLPSMPATGTIGLAVEGVLGDATPFKATSQVTIF